MKRARRMGWCVFLACLAPGLDLFGQSLPDHVLHRFRFREIGPTRQGGRITAIAVPDQHKRPYTFYVGASLGGVWKTVDNGITYQPIFDDQPCLSIGDIAVSASDPDLVWVGTGEANTQFWGDGLFKSTDGGATWRHVGLRRSHSVGRIRIHPTNPDVVYVAALGRPHTGDPQRGVFKTADGGKTWTSSLTVESGSGPLGAVDLLMDPSNPDVLYAATFGGEGAGVGIYKTVDGGRNWGRLTVGLPEGELGRIGIDLCLKHPNVLYASIMVRDRRSEENRVYRSDDHGETWRHVGPPAEANVRGGDFFGQIRIDPNDADHVYVLHTGIHETRDGGETWKRAFRYGGDHHALWIDPDNSRHMLSGYDYGFAMTFSGGETWYHADDLPLAQLYAGIGYDMDYPYNVYGGVQDFGSWKGPSTKKGRFPIRFEDWEHMKGGDGFYNQVDPNNSRWLYSGSQFGDFSRIDQRTGQRWPITNALQDKYRFNWNTPLVISPHNSRVLYLGAHRLLRSENRGETWKPISHSLARGREGTITSISESPITAGLIWVGTEDGSLHLTLDGGKSWQKLNDRLPDFPGYKVSRVIASHHYAEVAYVSLTGLEQDDFRPWVYKTDDAGKSWQLISADLPDEPVQVVREDHKNPQLLFVGTQRAIYVSIDGGSRWSQMSGYHQGRHLNGLPSNSITDLLIHPRENDLIVGTHGRGFFIVDITPLQQLTPDVLEQEVYLFDLESRVQWVMPSQKATSAQNFAGENEPHAVVIPFYLARSLDELIKVEVFQGARKIHEWSGAGQAGLNRLLWYMTQRRRRTESEVDELKQMLAEVSDEEDFFDFYDTVDFYLNPDDEVDALGRSLHTRVQKPGPFSLQWRYQRAQPGTYTVTLTVGGRQWSRQVDLLKDHWFDRRW